VKEYKSPQNKDDIWLYSLFITNFNYKAIKIKMSTTKMFNTILWYNLKAT